MSDICRDCPHRRDCPFCESPSVSERCTYAIRAVETDAALRRVPCPSDGIIIAETDFNPYDR